jgi:hypothetical protein
MNIKYILLILFQILNISIIKSIKSIKSKNFKKKLKNSKKKSKNFKKKLKNFKKKLKNFKKKLPIKNQKKYTKKINTNNLNRSVEDYSTTNESNYSNSSNYTKSEWNAAKSLYKLRQKNLETESREEIFFYNDPIAYCNNAINNFNNKKDQESYDNLMFTYKTLIIFINLKKSEISKEEESNKHALLKDINDKYNNLLLQIEKIITNNDIEFGIKTHKINDQNNNIIEKTETLTASDLISQFKSDISKDYSDTFTTKSNNNKTESSNNNTKSNNNKTESSNNNTKSNNNKTESSDNNTKSNNNKTENNKSADEKNEMSIASDDTESDLNDFFERENIIEKIEIEINKGEIPSPENTKENPNLNNSLEKLREIYNIKNK